MVHRNIERDYYLCLDKKPTGRCHFAYIANSAGLSQCISCKESLIIYPMEVPAMVTVEQLEKMQNSSIKGVGPDTLADILDVEISGDTPAERLDCFLAQVTNPYCFRVGKTPVRISFISDEKTLENKLKSYFISIRN